MQFAFMQKIIRKLHLLPLIQNLKWNSLLKKNLVSETKIAKEMEIVLTDVQEMDLATKHVKEIELPTQIVMEKIKRILVKGNSEAITKTKVINKVEPLTQKKLFKILLYRWLKRGHR